MSRAVDRLFLLKSCKYIADIDSEGCMYTLWVDLVPDIYDTGVSKSVGLL